jgi:hypothetical protein
VQPEYLQWCPEKLKEGAEVGQWICVDCRDELRSVAALHGVDVSEKVRVARCPCTGGHNS